MLHYLAPKYGKRSKKSVQFQSYSKKPNYSWVVGIFSQYFSPIVQNFKNSKRIETIFSRETGNTDVRYSAPKIYHCQEKRKQYNNVFTHQ